MKIQKFNESISNEIEEYFKELVLRFVNEEDFSHFETFDNSDDGGIGYILVVEFNTDKLNSTLFSKISDYIKFIESHADYEIFTGDAWISIESRFTDITKYEEKLMILIDTMKYNL